ncbi:ATP-binding cassette domain-containing protein [Chishuiella sp.]|uniref:ATP-binding cassette domain-containing protein n=1 Tax=Chishuiella sp. TaxID=1969467 RepID=UPI0028AA104D|nr:ATP-binding cassette domain-containing protein [Chishuiella sp.]
MNQPNFRLKIKSIKYYEKTILNNIDISINSVGLYGLFGRNGQGKSTLLKAIAGLKTYDGEIFYNSEDLKTTDIAFLATEPNVYEYLTAKEFYEFYQKVSGREKSTQNSDRVFDIDENIQLIAMSTGTLKKAYINCILQFDDYKIYIFDEPFNGLDIESNYILLNLIRKLAEKNIVFVSSHIIEIISPYLTKTFFVNEKKVIEVENENITSLFTQKLDNE